MKTRLDFRLDDLEPADAASEYAEQRFWSGDLAVLAEHHAPDGSAGYVVAHDGSATWGLPGASQIVAIKVSRDLDQNTFTVQSTEHSTIPFAQNWLTEHGCPPEAIAQAGEGLMAPADDLTVRIEQQIRTSGARYEVLDSHTSDYDPCENWTLTRDSTTSQTPVRVFVEEGDYDTHTYTLREGAFADEIAARAWLDSRDSPLPQPAGHHGGDVSQRTRAALARSSGATALPAGPEGSHQAPAVRTVPQPFPRRSM